MMLTPKGSLSDGRSRRPMGHRAGGQGQSKHVRAGALTLAWQIGFEVELMAPPGSSRFALASKVAQQAGGSVQRFFHPQSEPSLAPGLPAFENLTPGFAASAADGTPIAAFVDDLTLQAGLDRNAAPVPGWYRIVTDDARLLRLIMRHCHADAPLETVLDPMAALFGTATDETGGMIRVRDARGASVAIAAPLPGERDRPCEIVTPPIVRHHAERLAALLGAARAAGFEVPPESATHLHFDADRLCSARVVANLVKVLWAHGESLKLLFATNPRCVRLGPWPEALSRLVRSRRFADLPWQAAREALAGVGLTKYCDFNLVNLVNQDRQKHTFEVRILPTSLDAQPLVTAAAFFVALLEWCAEGVRPRRVPANLAALAREMHFDLRQIETSADEQGLHGSIMPTRLRRARRKGSSASAQCRTAFVRPKGRGETSAISGTRSNTSISNGTEP